MLDDWLVVGALAALALAMSLAPGRVAADGSTGACGVTEFSCRNSRCVRLDHYCDGRDHCGDNSDEPPHCTGGSTSR